VNTAKHVTPIELRTKTATSVKASVSDNIDLTMWLSYTQKAANSQQHSSKFFQEE
jgi:hypothetical protein